MTVRSKYARRRDGARGSCLAFGRANPCRHSSCTAARIRRGLPGRQRDARPLIVKGVRLADEDLSESLHELLAEVRAELGPYGWSVYAEQLGKQLSFEFRNPLSPVY